MAERRDDKHKKIRNYSKAGLESFKVDVEKDGLSSAVISAHEFPKSGGLMTFNKSSNFVFKKSTDGSWGLIPDQKRSRKTDRQKQDAPTKNK